MAIYVYQLTRHAYVCSPISQKRLEIFQQYFVKENISFRQPIGRAIEENISFP